MRPLLLGHRGARAIQSIPENTLASFDHALADGCDGFEFDVRLSADQVPVVCHDPRFSGRVISKTPAANLTELPRLEDVLSRYHSTAFLDLELKVAGAERIVVGLLARHEPHRGFVVSSFLPGVLKTLHELNSSIPLGLICDTKAQLARWRKLSLEYVIPHYRLMTEALVKEVHSASRKIFVWTVNNQNDMQRFADWRVDGIISDDTAQLAGTLRSLNSR